MILMPLIGVIIGGLLALAAWILSMIHNPQVSAIVLILIYIAITGGLHFDGVKDTTDAIFSARDHKRMGGNAYWGCWVLLEQWGSSCCFLHYGQVIALTS